MSALTDSSSSTSSSDFELTSDQISTIVKKTVLLIGAVGSGKSSMVHNLITKTHKAIPPEVIAMSPESVTLHPVLYKIFIEKTESRNSFDLEFIDTKGFQAHMDKQGMVDELLTLLKEIKKIDMIFITIKTDRDRPTEYGDILKIIYKMIVDFGLAPENFAVIFTYTDPWSDRANRRFQREVLQALNTELNQVLNKQNVTTFPEFFTFQRSLSVKFPKIRDLHPTFKPIYKSLIKEDIEKVKQFIYTSTAPERPISTTLLPNQETIKKGWVKEINSGGCLIQ